MKGTSVKITWIAWTALCCMGGTALAQSPKAIPLSAEPNHHLALANEYVNVYRVEVAPHKSVVLHRHDHDAVSVMLADSQVTVRTPDKPEVHAKLTGGQVRLQPTGYTHLTYIDGDTTYRNVTVELLRPQQNARNLCASVVSGKGLNCPAQPGTSPLEAGAKDGPQFETDQTKVTVMRVAPHQSAALSPSSRYGLLVMLDEAIVAGAGAPERSMRSGDFMWIDRGAAVHTLKNLSDRESRFVWFALNP